MQQAAFHNPPGLQQLPQRSAVAHTSQQQLDSFSNSHGSSSSSSSYTGSYYPSSTHSISSGRSAGVAGNAFFPAAAASPPATAPQASRPGSGSARQRGSSSSPFEPLSASGARGYRDQHRLPADAQAVPVLSRQPSGHQHRAAAPTPSAPLLPSLLSNRGPSHSTPASGPSSSSSGSSNAVRLLHRNSSNGSSSSSTSTSSSSSSSFSLSATASQLLSSLGALSGISLLGSSPGSSSRGSSSRGPHMTRAQRPSLFLSRANLRSSLLVRAPALLDAAGSDTLPDSYDDLLALDQFNVKRAVRPGVLSSLPSRCPCEQDSQQQRQCFICFDVWVPPRSPSPAAVGVGGCAAAVGGCAAAAAGGVGRDGCCAGQLGGTGWTGDGSLGGFVELRSPVVAGPMDGGSNSSSSSSSVTEGGATGQQRQQEQQGLGCLGSWGSGVFGLAAPADAAAAAAANAAAAGGGDGIMLLAHPHHTYRSAPAHCRSCRCGGAACFGSCQAPQQPSPAAAAAVLPVDEDDVYYEPQVVIQQLPCGHEYCAHCLAAWLEEHATCPICRWTFPDDQTHLINLHK